MKAPSGQPAAEGAVTDRVRRIVGSVCAEAAEQAGMAGFLLLDDDSPEAGLLHEWLGTLPGLRLWRSGGAAGNVHEQRAALPALVTSPANRTALLLGGMLPLADLLPLGDLWASQVAALAGGWSAPPAVRRLADAAGGVKVLDARLEAMLDGRRPTDEALAGLPDEVAGAIAQHYHAGRFSRLRPRLVPKLSARTLGMDLFD